MKISRRSYFYRFFRLFTDNNIPSCAAELAYYLLFAFFPILMVVYASFSLAGRNWLTLNSTFSQLLPQSIQELLTTFLQHIGSRASNLSFLCTGIVLALYSVSRFTKSVKTKVRMIYGSKTYSSQLAEWVVSFIFSFLLLVIFYVTLFVMIMGEHLINFLSQYIVISNVMQNIILILRYFITGFVVFVILSLFYNIIPNVRHRMVDVMPGTVFTLISWILVSYIFTYYINNIASYSVVYGSLGAFIILLLWFYMTSMLLLVGSIINCIAFRELRASRLRREISESSTPEQ